MAQPNFINFLGDIAKAYQCAEQHVGLKSLQDSTPKSFAHLISAVSFVAVGYFAYLNTNHSFLGAGFMAGLLISHIDPTWRMLPSLKRGALLPIDQKGSFALQKVYLISALLGKQYGLPTGFFMGNAFYYIIKENLFNG